LGGRYLPISFLWYQVSSPSLWGKMSQEIATCYSCLKPT
jgi:hypothetical protein